MVLELIAGIIGKHPATAAPVEPAAAANPESVKRLAQRRAQFSHRPYTRSDGFTVSGPRVR